MALPGFRFILISALLMGCNREKSRLTIDREAIAEKDGMEWLHAKEEVREAFCLYELRKSVGYPDGDMAQKLCLAISSYYLRGNETSRQEKVKTISDTVLVFLRLQGGG